jgi:hypothetical protein
MIRARSGDQDQFVTPDNIVELTGLSAAGWFEYLSLSGDPGDDVPGLPSVGKKRGMDLHAACPNMVRLLMAGEFDEVLRLASAAGGDTVKWADLAIKLIDTMRLTVALVKPYVVDLQIVDPEPASAEDLRAWLEPHGLTSQLEELMMLSIPIASDDPFAVPDESEFDDLPF